MIFYIYRITHVPSGRFYIGKRSYRGKDWRDDTYMGSGVIIKNLLAAHPLFHLRKEVLCFARDAEQLLVAERAAVNANYPQNPLCIPLCAGGRGAAGRTVSEATRAKMREAQRARQAKKRAEAAEALAAGAEFTTSRVWLHNNALRLNLSAAKDTAKDLLLLNAGWTVGQRAGYKKILQKALDRTTGLPL